MLKYDDDYCHISSGGTNRNKSEMGDLMKKQLESRQPPKWGGMNFLDSSGGTKRAVFSQIIGWGK